jgi:hypothetical protein
LEKNISVIVFDYYNVYSTISAVLTYNPSVQ